MLGVWRFRGVTYAFKEALRSSEIRMYRSTSSGWEQVPIHKIMGFKKGRWLQPERDQLVKGRTSGATAIIKEVALIDGFWPDANAEGSLVVDQVKGNFQADELLVVGEETGDNAVATGAVAVGVADDGFAGYRHSGVAADQVGNINATGTYPSQDEIRELGVKTRTSISRLTNPQTRDFSTTRNFWSSFPKSHHRFSFPGGDSNRAGRVLQYRWPLIQADLVNPPETSERISFRVRQKGYAPTHREMTATGPPVAQKIYAGPESRFQFVNHNFFGQAGQERMYGVSGSGPCFEFDGRTYISIFTGVDDDRPILVAAHEKHLFLAYKWGSIQISGLGRPRSFRAIDGAAEKAIGDEVTGMLSGFKGIMILTGRNRTEVLRGTSSLDWDLKTLSEEAGQSATP